MSKLLTLFVTGVTMLVLVGAGGNEPPRLPCQEEDFTQRSNDFVQLNAMLDLAMATGQLTTALKSIDPLVITDKSFAPTNFSFLFMNFSATPTIKTLNIRGLSSITPVHFNATSATGVDFGGFLNGTLDIDATLTLQVVQTSHKKWNLCWTDFWHPKDCPPTQIPMTFNVSFTNPSIVANTNVAMLRCPQLDPSQVTNPAVCTDLTVNDIVTAALLQNYMGFFFRLMRRISRVDVTGAQFTFEQMSELNFHMDKTNDVTKWIYDKLYGWSQKHLNKHSTMYNEFVKIASKRTKEVIAKLIGDRLAPFFGGTCYDT